MNKNDLRYIKTEKGIKEAFIGLLEEGGIEKATVKAVCERALISRNTFYLHYETAEYLIESIYEDLRNDFHREFETLETEIANMQVNTRWYIDVVDKHRRTIKALLKCDTRHFDNIIFEYIVRRPMLGLYPDFDRYISDVRLKMNAAYIIKAMISYTSVWLDNYDALSKQQVIDDLYILCDTPARIFLNGVKQKAKENRP